jgi:hypothetical protein
MTPYTMVLCAALLPAAVYSAHITNTVQVESSASLPVLVFKTGGQAIQDRTRIPGYLTILTPNAGRAGAFTPSDDNGKAELSVRGNSSFYYPKKSYRVELQDENARDRKASLLGMPADSDWVLYASVTDRTFTRNLLGHELWRSMGRYAVRWRFVEVFVITNVSLNELKVPNVDHPHPIPLPQERANELWPTAEQLAGEIGPVLDAISVTNPAAASLHFSNANNTVASTLADSYRGVYVLMEKLKRGKNRVDIKRLKPEHTTEPEITGGYIIKKDDQGRGERGFLTGQEFKLRYEEPKESELTAVQRAWMGRYLDDFEKALFGRNFRDSVNGYRKYLDADSFIDFHWLVEVARNADGYWFSQYMHKDRGGKLTMGPVWDWDNTFGNPYFNKLALTNGWRFEVAEDPDYTWYRRLFEDPDFLQRYIDRWSELRSHVLSTSNVLALVDRIDGELKGSHRRNGMRWEYSGPAVPIRARAGVAHEEEIKSLKEWLVNRLAWIDSQEFPKPVTQILDDHGKKTLAMGWLNGRIFYTTDGTDPRAPGGGVANTALEYTAPINFTSGSVVTARVRSNFGLWSAPVRVRPAGSRPKESK